MKHHSSIVNWDMISFPIFSGILIQHSLTFSGRQTNQPVRTNKLKYTQLTTTLHSTLMMTSANWSWRNAGHHYWQQSFKYYPRLDDQTNRANVAPGSNHSLHCLLYSKNDIGKSEFKSKNSGPNFRIPLFWSLLT